MYGCGESQYEAFDVTKQAPQENAAITLNEPDDTSLDVFSLLKKLLRD
jgi:hypothetical protein